MTKKTSNILVPYILNLLKISMFTKWFILKYVIWFIQRYTPVCTTENTVGNNKHSRKKYNKHDVALIFYYTTLYFIIEITYIFHHGISCVNILQ